MRHFHFFGGAAVFAVSVAAASAAAEPLDGIAVVVDNQVITYAQIQEAIPVTPQKLAALYPDPQTFRIKLRELQENARETLIEAKLILADFDKSGYETNALDHAIDDNIQRIIKDKYYGDRSRLIKTLQAEGISYETFKKQQRDDFIVYYMDHNNPGIKKMIISPLKIQTYYNEHPDEFKVEDQVKLRMIAIPDSPSAPGTARKLADEVLQKIDGGVPFAEMAAVYTSGATRASGGDRGWVERKDFVPALSDVAFSLKPGQHSQVVEVPGEHNGPSTCYLLMLDEARPSHISPLAEVRGAIEVKLKDEETKRLVQQWLARLKAKSHIEYF